MSEFIKNHGNIEAPGVIKEKVTSRGITVVKVGGSTYQERVSIVEDVAKLHKTGQALALIHGGGLEIDEAMKAANIQPKKLDGKRVTDDATLKIVVEVLEKINGQIRGLLTNLGVPTCGFLSDHRLLLAEIDNPALGLVGNTPVVNNSELMLLETYISRGVVPVISPIAIQKNNPTQKLNVNGDIAARSVAAALSGSKLVLLTDVPGVIGGEGQLIKQLDLAGLASLKAEGVITGGMIPKVEACLTVVGKGGSALICSGSLLTAFSENPIGTIIKQNL